MSPPTFSSFPTTRINSPKSDSKSIPHISSRPTPATSGHSDTLASSSAHQLPRSAKRRKKEEHATQRFDNDDGHVVYGDALPLGKRSHNSNRAEPSESQARDGPSGWSRDQVMGDERSNEQNVDRTQSHYVDAIGDKEMHFYGATASLACPHYRRDESTCTSVGRGIDARWPYIGAISSGSNHKVS